MALRDLLSEMPIVGELLVDYAELWDGVSELATGSLVGYAALREKMEWIDIGSGDTRTAMLAAASEVPPAFDDNGEIVAGQWTDPYTGFTSTAPSDFDLDHRVPFKAVAESVPGFMELSLHEQLAHFNDPDNLQVLHDGHNAWKGDSLPAEYAERIDDPSLRQKFLDDCSRYANKIGIQL